MHIPVIALRNMVVVPGMLIHFDIKRKKSILAVENAMKENIQVLLTAQINASQEEPDFDDLYSIGTIAAIKQMVKLPGGIIRVLAYGVERGELCELSQNTPFLIGEVESKPIDNESLTNNENIAMLRSMYEILDDYTAENTGVSKEITNPLYLIDDIARLLEQILIHIPISTNSKQYILEADGVILRYQRIAITLSNEIEINRIKKELQDKVRKRVDKNQKEYIMREQMKVIREELGETDTATDADNFMLEAEKLDAPENVREKIIKEIKRFRGIASNSAESSVSRGYIEALLALPWNHKSKDKSDIVGAKKILDKDHYGLEKVKERILEFLAVRALTERGDSPIICLVGPPGTGKTSIAKSVARALNKKYVRVCLGGVRDEAEIRGHRRTYVGAMPGRLIDGLKSAGVGNPLILLDEIDKVSSDYKGDVSSALLEVLDSEQNSHFVDHYIELPVDLSEVLFIATANTVQSIPRPLLDRMEIIEVNSYTSNEKFHIAKEHLINKQKNKNGLKAKQLRINDKALELIISGYTKEAGVRSLERRIGEICRKAARELLEGGTADTIKVTEKNIEQYLGKVKYVVDKANDKDEVGIVRGLAWTSVGGDTLQIEVNTMPGKGNLELTGQLGDVMKESARAGVSYIRSISPRFDIEPDYFEKHDFHIHIPEGGVPKDGPSAGITMATAMLSAITGYSVKPDVAMTGEITLRGRVLPVGGLKEKILAAKASGIKTVLIPEKNRRDLDEFDSEILQGVEIVYVSTMDEVSAVALNEWR